MMVDSSGKKTCGFQESECCFAKPRTSAAACDSGRDKRTRFPMKKLIIPPAGPPGPIPGDISATEPPKSQPERTLSMDPNDLPPPPEHAASDEELKRRNDKR
jgi:hypothetical protein